jgi:hypothetical protein
VTGDAKAGLVSRGACTGAVAADACTVGISAEITTASTPMRLNAMTSSSLAGGLWRRASER